MASADECISDRVDKNHRGNLSNLISLSDRPQTYSACFPQFRRVISTSTPNQRKQVQKIGIRTEYSYKTLFCFELGRQEEEKSNCGALR